MSVGVSVCLSVSAGCLPLYNLSNGVSLFLLTAKINETAIDMMEGDSDDDELGVDFDAVSELDL